MHIARSLVVVAMLSMGVSACSADETDSDRGLEVRLKLSDEASAADVGLPTYPGSRAYKDPDDSSSAANLGLSTPLFGFKVVAMNLETSDSQRRVAAFYRQALSKYGDVLECSEAADEKRMSEPSAAQDDDELTCESSKADKHSVVYKVGTDKHQRIVAIKPHGNGTRFSLVYVDVRDE